MRLVKNAGNFSLSGDMKEIRAIHARLSELIAGIDAMEAAAQADPKARVDLTSHPIALGLVEVDGMDEEA